MWDQNFQNRLLGFNRQNKEYMKWLQKQENKKNKRGIKESVFSYDLMNKFSKQY